MLLKIEDLNIHFDTLKGKLHAIRDLSFHINQGETLGIVGESGCGKSITSLATMGLLPPTATVSSKTFSFQGSDLISMPEKEKRKLRGGDMAMIFQDPMTSLNPSYTVGFQIIETLKIHQGGTSQELNQKAINLLNEVGIPAPENRMKSYPHQLSGGMCQRIMIAMAIACRPKLLIADEPTTALDVTIQAQILSLLKKLQKDYDMGLILITHDIGVVAQMADRILVMYAGECVESGNIKEVLKNAKHPYTKGLLDSLPAYASSDKHRTKLSSISGMVPNLSNRPVGCQFAPRCFAAQDKCNTEKPLTNFNSDSRSIKCFYPIE